MSRRRTLQSRQWVPHSLEQVWAFFSDPSNLEKLTPPSYRASVKVQGEFREGCKVVIALKPYGIPVPLKWISAIQGLQTSAERCEFVDVQLSGPFAFWRHHHIFETGDREFHGKRSEQTLKIDSGGTWIIDDVEYELPYGIFGAVAESLFARKQLESMFAYRKTQTLALLGDP
jgi:ligand-binding SRPBCC domain-containing protein